MVTYETATPEEIAQVLQAISDTDSVPVGYAYNPGWSPPIRKVVGGGADPAAIRAARIVRGAEFDALIAAAGTTTFHADGSITSDPASGATQTVTFNPDGSITTAYGAPLNTTIRTTFAGDTITEVSV